MKKLSLSIVALLMCYSMTFAQEKAQEKTKPEPYKNWEIGVNVGVANFTGEYNMFKDAQFNHFNHFDSDMNFGFGASLKKNFSHLFALEGAWSMNKLTGSWGESYGSSPDFETKVNEYDLNTVWNINNLFSKNKFDRKLYWYAKVGLGATHVMKPKGVNPMLGDGHWKLPTIPLGTGVAFKLSDRVKLDIGTQWSWVNTDRLDGFSSQNGTIAMKAGNPVANVYGTKLYTHVGLSYVFGKKKKVEPVVEAPKPEPKPEPKAEPKPEPKPEPVVVAKPAVIGNVYKVYFAFDKWDLNNDAKADLDRLAQDMNENASVNVDIKSHTDSRGPASYNMKLSEKRGKAVIDYLTSKGVSASRVNAEAFGETQPVNKCVDGVPCTKAEYALNRRTETIVIE